MKIRIAVRLLAAAIAAGGVLTATAAPAMADGSFPLYDANGVQRSSVSYNSVGRYAIACYPGDFQLVIQAKLDNGEIVPRYVDWAQCNVATAYGEHTIVEVSGLIDGFQNEWHKVS